MSTDERMTEIRASLQTAFAADLRREAPPEPTGLRAWLVRRPGRRLIAPVAVLVLAAPGAAFAAGVFTTTPQQEEAGLPAGTQLFAGDPATCTTVQPNVEFRCTLQTPPTPDTEPVLTEAQSDQVTEAPPSVRPTIDAGQPLSAAQLQTIAAYKAATLESFGWSEAQAEQYANDQVPAMGIRAGQFLNAKVDTVDADHQIDGGCSSTSTDGSTWECYVGEAAVQQGIVTPPDGPHSGLWSDSDGPVAG